MVDAQVIIMAGGKGARMQSDLPKVLHKIGNHTMLDMILNNASAVTDDIILVYSKALLPYLSEYNITKVLQREPKGTGHAVYCALNEINPAKYVIVLCGDNPFIDGEIINKMLVHHTHQSFDISIMAFDRLNPVGYGRIIIDADNMVRNIIECRDASDEEQKITLCNSGIIIFSPGVITSLLPGFIEKSPTCNEYYLTSLLSISYAMGLKNGYFTVNDEKIIGVNTKEELEMANKYYANARQEAL